MNNDPKSLIALYVDDALSPEQGRELSVWVNQSPANAEQFAREMVFHRRLFDICRGRNVLSVHDQDDEAPPTVDPRGKSMVMPAIDEEVEPAEEQIISPPPISARVSKSASRRQRHSTPTRGGVLRHWRWFAVAAGLGLAACLIVALLPRSGSPARVTALAGVDWGGNAIPVGSELDRGQTVQIRSGTAELTFASGAKVVLQGPVAFEVSDRNAGALDYGKLVAHVPGPAAGFAVVASNLKVSDLGTEFGFSVNQAGVAQVQVFQGTVEITRPDQTTGSQPPIRLSANQAVSCQVEEGEIKTTAPEPDAFVRDVANGRLPLTLHNTGIGLRPGNHDPNWTLLLSGEETAARAAVVASTPVRSQHYMPDDPDHSQWLSSVASLSPVSPGLYVFRSTLDLTGFDPATAVIHVKAVADDRIAEVWINGRRVELPPTALSWTFTKFHTFDLTGPFQGGINTIEFRIPNAPPTPTGMGLRVEWEGTAAPIVQR